MLDVHEKHKEKRIEK